MLSRSRSTIRDAGWQAVSSGRVPGKAAGGGWPVAFSRHGSGMATGKRLASLLSTWTKSMPLIRSEGRQPQTLPVKQILRYGQGDPWAVGESAV